MIRHQIERYWDDQHVANDYDLVYSPHIGKASLWETSGHLGFYKENMYSPIQIEEQEYYIKPMNCPFHLHIYKASCDPTGICRCDLPRRVRSIATSAQACCTVSCACAASPRTMPTTSADRTRCRTKSTSRSTSA